MEAPIPASALIHSATLVSIGIFISLKFYLLFFLYNNILLYISIITCLYGGINAIFQSDLKKILAYSTISHCGILIVFSLTNKIEFCLIYFFIHGFFKALSFLLIGLIIKFFLNMQNLEKFGQNIKIYFFLYYSLLFCFINLSSFPIFLGFFTKHFFFLNFSQNNFFICFFCSFTGFLYCYKLIFYIFFHKKKYKKYFYKKNIFYKNISLHFSLFLFIYLFSFYIVFIIIIIFFYNYNLSFYILLKNFIFKNFIFNFNIVYNNL
jgi:NADH:ubiquinone oxidoreductase subunit 5 (subunit L)/multisubunit Na+/H+ antiporter MnhA subunit